MTLISYGFEHSMFFPERIQETEASVSDVIDNLNSITPEELESKLSKLYASLQTRKRKEYSKFALAGLRAGINRFFRQPPKNKLFNTMKDIEFQKSNTELIGILKILSDVARIYLKIKSPFPHLHPVVQSIVILTISLRHKFVKQISAKVTNTLLFFVEIM